MALKASQLKVGDTHTERVVEDLKRTQIVQYAGASGDYNPLHTDEIFTTKVAGYPSVFAHGMLTMGMTGKMLTDYVGDARRFDMGERSNFASLPAALRAMKQLLEWDIVEISETIGVLNRQLATAAAEFGFLSPPDHLRAPHYLCLRRKEAILKELPEMLAREKVFVSVRGSSIRVTPHVYNTVEDAERLISCLKQTASGSR